MRTILSKLAAIVLFLLSSLSITANTDPFSFTAIVNTTPNTLITSNIATISGFDSTVSIRIEGGSYTIGDSVPTTTEGVITAGATVTIQVLSSSEFNTQTVATLTVGSGVSLTRAIFSVTTRPPPRTPVFTTVKVNGLYQYVLSASDADSANLEFSVATNTDLPSWLGIGLVITTLAGDGLEGRDNGATSTASFNSLARIAIDAGGNIIIADSNNHRIRSITPEGIVSTIAGSGSSGLVNGASATAKFSFPTGVAIDASGNIIIADTFNHRIRSINPHGIVNTIAGTGLIGATSGDFADGASATARFNFPRGVAIDASGSIIVADSGNNRIRSIALDGMVRTTAGGIAGSVNGPSNTAKFNNPFSVAIDNGGNIVVADTSNHLIRNISLNRVVSTIAGSGTGFVDGASATAKFSFPTGVAIDASGNIFVADRDNHRIRSIAIDGIVGTIAGIGQGFADGVDSNAQFDSPFDVAIDASGNIVVADRDNQRIRKIDRNISLAGIPPDCDDIGIYNLVLIVSDGEFQDLQSFDITVVDDGSCGVIPTNLALSATNVIENIATNSIIATISADDSDNPASLSFSIVGGRDSASFSIIAGNQLVINHSPDFEAQNSYEIIIAVSDTMHQLIKTFNIGVNDVNDVSPIFTSVPITRVRVNSLYQYDLDASDADSSNLVFSVSLDTELPDWLAIDAVVTTLAGNGLFGSDDGASATAKFSSLEGVAIDTSGNIIVVDRDNHRIRSISPDGMVSTFAGGGPGSVDGASATAQFRFPSGIVIDASGNIIVADSGNHRIRKITSAGTVSTIAGGGLGSVDGASATAQFRSPFGITIDASGDIIVADNNNHRIRRITPGDMVSTIAGGSGGFINGASATAQFNFPTGVAVDTLGNIIVADSSNNNIRSISTGGIVSTFAGVGEGFVDGASATAKFSSPAGIAVDALGNIIVADDGNHSIRSISTGGVVTTIAGSIRGFTNGIGSNAQFSNPFDIAIDSNNDIIVADRNNYSVRKIDRNKVIVGTPACSDIGMHNLALIVSDGELQGLQSFDITVADDGSCGFIPTNLALSTTNVIENTATNSIIATISADDSDNPASLSFSIVGGRDSASFSISAGNQLVIDHSPDFEAQNSYEIIIAVSDVIHQLTKTFNIGVNDVNDVSPIFTSIPITSARVNSIYQYNLDIIDVDSTNFIFSAASSTELPSWLAIDVAVSTLAGNGLAGRNNGATNTATFNFPLGVAIDAFGNIIVADTNNDLIRSISSEGIVSTIAGSETGFLDGASATAQFDDPSGVAVDALGNIIVADSNNNRIRKITPNGIVTTIAGSGGADAIDGASATASFDSPSAVAIDSSGDIIVADRANNLIRSISGGIVSTIAGGGGVFSFPTGVAIDALGNIIVADAFNSRIRSIASDGTVTTIAGSGFGSADGASATAQFSTPRGVAIDALGNIIVADQNNDRIRRIAPDGTVSTIAGGTFGFVNGPSNTAKFDLPFSVAIDAIGNIIVADSGNNSIRKIYRNSLVGTPACGDIGMHNLALIVSDGELQDLQSFDITVADDGSCGVAPVSLTLSTTTIVENILADSIIATISATATNPLGVFEFSIVGGRDSASFSITSGNQLVIDHSPDFETQNSYEIIIAVSDAMHQLTKTFNIGVSDVNEVTPVFTSVPITSVRVNSLYQYGLDASDIDSDNLAFSIAPNTALPSWLAVGIAVTTLAGDGSTGNNNGATGTASFNNPRDVAIDALGNIIVADRVNNSIRSITPEGTVTTIAGTISTDFVDGASATARFRRPTGVAIDTSGNIIVADSDNHSIRSISPEGIVSTIAGDGLGSFMNGASPTARFNGPGGVAVDASGNIIIADSINTAIRSISLDGTVTTIAGISTGLGSGDFVDGASATARFRFPSDVAIDASGNIIIADSFNNAIRSINASSVVTTIAGSRTSGFADGATNTARFDRPFGVAIDASGNIIVADSNNHSIRNISPDGMVTTIAGSDTPSFADGVGTTSKFQIPTGVAIDALGNIIVADSGNNRIRKIDRNDYLLGTYPSCGDIGIYSLELIVSDGEFQDSQSFDITVVDDGSCGAIPTGLALSTTTIVENILANSIIATIDATATNSLDVFEFSIVGGRDSASFSISSGNQLVINHSPNFEAQSSYEIIIGVSDTIHLVTKTFNIDVSNINEFSPIFTSAPITSVRVNSLYQYDLSASDVDGSSFVFSVATATELPDWLAIGAFVTTLAGDGLRDSDDGATSTASFSLPRGVAIDALGNIIVADSNNHLIRSISPSGTVTTIAGSGPGSDDGATSTATFFFPTYIAIDALGNIIVADRGNHRIRNISPDGMVTTVAGSSQGSADGATSTAEFSNPSGVAIDALGNIIVADSGNRRIRSISLGGTVTTIAGSVFGFADGASATAMFSDVRGVAIDALGNIIVADGTNYRIRSISLGGTVTTIAGSVFGFADGASATAKFGGLSGVAIDALGNIIVADGTNHRIRSISPDGLVSTVAGSSVDFNDEGFVDGIGSSAKFNSPLGVAIDANDIIVVDTINDSIRKIDRSNLLGTPLKCSDIGIYNLELIVSDGELQSSQSFTIRVMSDSSCILVAPFIFDAVSDVALGATITSNAIIVATNTQDLQSTFTISIEGSNARYSINGGSYTDASGVVSVGDNVRVQIVASNQLNTAKTATVSIRNIASAFTITTTNLIIVGGDSTVSYNNLPITIDATSNDSQTIPITWTSSATSVVSFDDPNIGLITIVGVGSALITARRGDDESSIIFTVEPLTLTPTFASPQSFIYNTNTRTVVATITSGIVSTDDIGLTISGVTTATDVGNYNIGLNLIGASTPNYRLSTTTLSWSIIKADQMLTYTSDIISIDYKPNNATATSQDLTGAQTTISYTTSPTTNDVVTIDDSGIITILNTGSVVIIASAVETNNYNPRAASYLLTINLIDQTGFTIVLSSPLELEATTTATVSGGQSTGAISFTSSNPIVATIDQDGLISVQSLGTTTIMATRAGDRNYNDISASALLTVVEIDITPDAFSFSALVNAEPNTLISSNIATITGFDSTLSIRIEGGSYTVGASEPTAAEGVITAGATITVQVLSSSEFDTQTIATLTVGYGGGTTSAIFSVTTRLDPAITPNSITLTLSATTTIADNTITVTVSASNSSGAIDIAELVATVVLAGAAVSTNGNEITYTPSAAGNETISVISINGIDVSGISGSSATFEVTHGALTRIELEPQNPTFLVNGVDTTGVTITVTLYDANNNLVLTDTAIRFAALGGGGFETKNGRALSGTGTVEVLESEQRTGIVTIVAGAISATTTVTSVEIANIGFVGISNTNTDSPITITISATDSVGDTIDISELEATVVLADASILISSNQITYIPSIIGTETISVTSINGLDVSSIIGSSATFNITRSTLTRIELEPSPQTIIVNYSAIASVTLFGINNNLFLAPTTLTVNIEGPFTISSTTIISSAGRAFIVVEAIAVGVGTLTISINDIFTTTTITATAVEPLIIIGGDITAIYGDDAISITSQGGNPAQPITWTSSTPTIATIDENSGVVTIIDIGTTTITASRGSSQVSISLLVNPRQLGLSVGPTDTLVFNNTSQTIAVSLTNAVEDDINSGAISLTISGDQTAINAGSYQFSVSISGSASPNYIFAPTTISWVVDPARQSELDITNNATRLMVGQTTTATATNDQPQGTLTITSSEAGIATINGSTITAINIGITTITITKQVANHNNISASYQLLVIQNTTTPIDAGDDRAATYIPSGILSPQIPTNAQDRVISYAINPIASDVVTIDSNSGAITIINVGTVNIIASAATTTNYAASTDTYLLTINQAAQDPFTITASDTLTFGATNAIAIVDPGSGDGTITYESNNIAIATITNNGIITATGVGEAIITATRDGGRNYLNTSATHSLIVERANQANFVISGSSTLTNAQTSFVTATGGSGTGTISFSSSNPDIATISQSGVITAQSLGTTTISATKSGGDNYRDISDSYLLTIINTTPTVTNLIPNQIASLGNLFTLIIPANTFNDANGDTLTISVSALPPSLTFDGINSITGIPATVGVSDITVTADDGNGAMVSTSFSLTVSDDFIIVGNNPRNVVYGAASQNIIAQGGASLTGAITFVSSTPSIVNFGDANIGVLAILGAGTAIITATREGTGEQASVSFIVSPRTITPTFAGSQTFIYNTNIRTVLATITSGIVGTDDVSLAISGATATDVGNYNIGLALTGASSLNYLLSTTTLSWSIIKANQTEFTIMISSALALGATTIATASGGQGTGVVSFASSNPTIAIISQDGLITAQNLGTTTITATKAGDSNYNDISTSTLLEVIPRFNLDIDGDGSRLTTTDGILILRYLTDPRTFTTTGATTTNATMDAQTIENSLEAAYQNNILDVDNSGTTEASSDGMLIMRYLADQENLNTTGATTTTSTDIDTITLNLQNIYQ